MSEWMMKCSELFKPLYAQLQKILLQQCVIQVVKTTLKVIKEAEIAQPKEKIGKANMAS